MPTYVFSSTWKSSEQVLTGDYRLVSPTEYRPVIAPERRGHKVDDPYTHFKQWDKDREAIIVYKRCTRCLRGPRMCENTTCEPLPPDERARVLSLIDAETREQTREAQDYGMAPPTVIENVRMKNGRPVCGPVEPMRTGITALGCDWMTRQWKP